MKTLKATILCITSIFCIVSVAFSGITLFTSPSRSSNNFLLEIDFRNANFNALYKPVPYRELTISDTRLDDIYRFGLWGYCSGALNTSTGDFVKKTCSESKQRYKPDIGSLLQYNYIEGGQGTYTGFDVGSYFASISTDDFENGFNGIYAGFIISLIELVLVGALILSIFISLRLELILWPLVLASSMAQWVSITIGLALTAKGYNSVDLVFDQHFLSWSITSRHSNSLLKFGWIGMAMSLIALISLSVVFVLLIMHKRKNQAVFCVRKEEPC